MAPSKLSGEELLRQLEEAKITNSEMVRVLEEDYGVEVDEAIKEQRAALRALFIQTLTGRDIPEHVSEKIYQEDEVRQTARGKRGEAYNRNRGNTAYVHKAGGGPKR